jgi:hypothetical protein
MTAQQPSDYEIRFSGYDLTTLGVLTGRGDACYDHGANCWRIAASAVPQGLPAVVLDVDWQAADAAMRATATPPEQRPLVFARAVTPTLTVGLDESLTLVLQVPEGAIRQTVSNGDALKLAVDEARTARRQIEAELAADFEQYGPAADADAEAR